MRMPVLGVRIVPVSVRERVVLVDVCVRDAGRHAAMVVRVGMIVMDVMDVDVVMQHGRMPMRMLMILGDVQIHAEGHQRAGQE